MILKKNDRVKVKQYEDGGIIFGNITGTIAYTTDSRITIKVDPKQGIQYQIIIVDREMVTLLDQEDRGTQNEKVYTH